MTTEQHDHLKESMERFGLVDPLIVNSFEGRENVIIGGHQRLKIALELEMPTVPCVHVKLDPAKEKELNLRLNKNLGEWDFDKLANEFDDELLKLVGFTDKDMGIEVGGVGLEEGESHECPECGFKHKPPKEATE